MIQKIKEAAKMVAALVGALLTAGTTFIPASWSPWLGLLLALLTDVATYAIPNAPPTPATDNANRPLSSEGGAVASFEGLIEVLELEELLELAVVGGSDAEHRPLLGEANGEQLLEVIGISD